MLKTLHCTFVFASVSVQPGNDTSFVSRSSLEFGKKPKTKDKFNIVCLWVFNLFPFQLFSHTCSRHLKVSLPLSFSYSLSLAAFLPHRLHKLVFAWRRRISVSKHGRRIVIFISDASVPRTSPSLTRFSQHLTTESEMEKGTGRTGVGGWRLKRSPSQSKHCSRLLRRLRGNASSAMLRGLCLFLLFRREKHCSGLKCII